MPNHSLHRDGTPVGGAPRYDEELSLFDCTDTSSREQSRTATSLAVWCAIACSALACSAHGRTSLEEPNSAAQTSTLDPSPVELEARTSRDESSSAPVSAGSPKRAARDLPYLSPKHVAAAVRARQAEFFACQALADLESRRGAGSVTVGWLVDADGRVLDARIGPTSFTSVKVNQCVLTVARGMTFPASSLRTEVSWTVKFQGGAGGAIAGAASSPY